MPKSLPNHIPLLPNLWALAVLTLCVFTLSRFSDEWREVDAQVNTMLGGTLEVDVVITLIVLLLMTLPMLLRDSARFFTTEKNNDHSIYLVAIKTLGIWSAFGFVGFLYWLLPEYGQWYQRYWLILEIVVPWLVGLTPFYVWLVTPRQVAPKDGYYDLGLIVLAIFRPSLFASVRMPYLYELGRQWLIKAFFLPLMLVYFFGNITSFIEYQHPEGSPSVWYLYDFSYLYIFSIDLSFAVIGYIFTLKILDTDIRSTDPSVLGWVACLMCYSPFWNGLFEPNFFHYESELFWGDWLEGYPFIYGVWAMLIIVLITLYSFATVSLGYRFSNLTYRGLSTTGVFRLTKHPAYVFKNLSWWMISIPFIPSGDGLDALRSCLLLLGVNTIYFLRARTEERHLSQYPEYVEYATWINEHGIFRFVGRAMPFFRYDAQKTLQLATPVWWRQAGLSRFPRFTLKYKNEREFNDEVIDQKPAA